jgi:hypothetical protein
MLSLWKGGANRAPCSNANGAFSCLTDSRLHRH